ncbi:MAG: MBL fold metallo-hydrolase [Dehalococcoidia bacterium]|nr:MAG: MBL fold metallo-hydrolase [Dehalococcoidia bacterium]
MPIGITTLSENTATRLGVLAEWGLSILIQVDDYGILLDAGQGVSAAYNATVLGMDLSRVERIVLSHGHRDHTGGLLHILKLVRKQIEVIAHPDIWAAKYALRPGRKEEYIGMSFPREAAESSGASFNLTKEPVWISENIVTSGEIPMLTEYETIDPILCVKEPCPERSEGTALKPDPLRDDQAVFIKSERGLIVVLGCAHRGVINTLRYAQKLTGVEPIYAVIGGIHLVTASSERISLTIADLKKLGIQRLGVSHCTGLPASAILAREFGESFFFNNAGTRVGF